MANKKEITSEEIGKLDRETYLGKQAEKPKQEFNGKGKSVTDKDIAELDKKALDATYPRR